MNATTKNSFNFVDTTVCFERSATARAFNEYLRMLEAPGALQADTLFKATKAAPLFASSLGGTNATTSKSMVWRGSRISSRGFVLLADVAGIVTMCADVDGMLMLALETYDIKEYMANKSVLVGYVCKPSGQQFCGRLECHVQAVTCWSQEQNGELIVLV